MVILRVMGQTSSGYSYKITDVWAFYDKYQHLNIQGRLLQATPQGDVPAKGKCVVYYFDGKPMPPACADDNGNFGMSYTDVDITKPHTVVLEAGNTRVELDIPPAPTQGSYDTIIKIVSDASRIYVGNDIINGIVIYAEVAPNVYYYLNCEENISVDVYINGNFYQTIGTIPGTSAIILNYSAKSPGTYTFEVKFKGLTIGGVTYKPSSTTYTVDVIAPCPTTINFDKPWIVGYQASISASLLHAVSPDLDKWVPLVGANVDAEIDGHPYGTLTTDSRGGVVIHTTFETDGVHTIVLRYKGDPNGIYAPSSASINVQIGGSTAPSPTPPPSPPPSPTPSPTPSPPPSPTTAKVSLAIISHEGGTTNPAPGTYQYDKGSSVTITAIPHSGYEFDHWTVNGSIAYSNPLSLTLESDTTVEAYFGLPQTPPTSVPTPTPTPPPAPAPPPETTPQPAPQPQPQPQPPVQIIISEPTGSEAPPVEELSGIPIKILVASGAGDVDPSPGIHYYEPGSDIVIKARPDPGYSFDYFLIDGSTAFFKPTMKLTVNAEHTVEVYFSPGVRKTRVIIPKLLYRFRKVFK